MINKSNCRWAVVWFCYHSYDYRPNWTPLNLITITYNEKYQINYCWNRVLTTLKVLVSLSSARTPLRLISVYQVMISSFRSHRAIFPRFNNVPAKKPEILCCWKTYCLNGKWTYRQSRKSWKFSREFTQNNQQRRNAPIQWSLSISEGNLLIKGYGKHQQSLVKKSCKVMQFYWSERIRSPLFLGSSVRKNFDPTFVTTLQGSNLSIRFQKGQIQESTWKSGLTFYKVRSPSGAPDEVQWNSVYLNC